MIKNQITKKFLTMLTLLFVVFFCAGCGAKNNKNNELNENVQSLEDLTQEELREIENAEVIEMGDAEIDNELKETNDLFNTIDSSDLEDGELSDSEIDSL